MIDSVNNSKVSYYKKLRDSKYIKENKEYIVEGETLVMEAYNAGLLKCVLSSKELNIDVPTILMSNKCLEKISLLKSTPGIMGVVKLKEEKEILGTKIVLLDNVQDPGNVGTIIRSARAFNVDTVILSLDSANIYNDKVVRSSEGAIFDTNVITMDLKDAINVIKEKGIRVYYADMFGEKEISEENVKEYALVLGSEGKGISKEIKDMCDEGIRIDMNKRSESLNVAISASIIMHSWRN